MKSLFTTVCLLSILIYSCTYNEKPIFISVENIELLKISNKQVTFKANAVFQNKNDIGGELVTDNITVFANNILIGQLKTEQFNVPARDTFTIPLTGHFSAEKILNNKNNDLINNVLSILTSKKIPITFKGNVIFKKGSFSYSYSIDQTNNVTLKF